MRALVPLLSLLLTVQCLAHEIRPGLLLVTQQQDDQYTISWKLPRLGDAVPRLRPELPEGFRITDSSTLITSQEAVFRFKAEYPHDLHGRSISIHGLENKIMDVLLQVNWKDGTTYSEILTPRHSRADIPEAVTAFSAFNGYLAMGMEHIWEGIDHLLFVVMILLFIGSFGRLLRTITAFTLAHSITLCMASMGLIAVPSPPVEALIALSIVFMAREFILWKRGKRSYTARNPWVVAFAFGLVHGLGFAGALADIGLPANQIPVSLLAFNLGVEAGQLIFVCLVLLPVLVIRRVIDHHYYPGIQYALSYGIGGLALAWTVERVVGFWG